MNSRDKTPPNLSNSGIILPPQSNGGGLVLRKAIPGELMAASKSKVMLGVILVAVAAILIFLQFQTQQKLRAENESLQQQMAQLKSESQDQPATNSNPTPSEDFNELLRLRGEVSALRGQGAVFSILLPTGDAESRFSPPISTRS